MNPHSRASCRFVHCCVQKTASQSFFALYSSDIFRSLTGLKVLPFTEYADACQGIPDWRRDEDFYRLAYRGMELSAPFPSETIGCPFYIGYPTFRKLATKHDMKAIFVTRDPRDILLSGYFSMRDSHPEMEANSSMRRRLRDLGFAQGLEFYMDYLLDLGVYEAQRTWHEAARCDDGCTITLLRYESLADEYDAFFPTLLRVFDLQSDSEEASILQNTFAFQAQKNSRSYPEGHLRRGRSGEWREKLTPELVDKFHEKTGSLIEELGYSTNRPHLPQ